MAVWNLLFSLFLFAKKLRLAIHFLDYISSRCPLLVKRCFRNCIETSNFKQLGLVQVKSGSQLQIQDRHYGPSKKKKIPPELTNRYVKDEAFIVVYRRILKITTKAANNLFCCDYFFIPTVAAHQRPHLSCQLSVWPRVSQQHL